MGVDRGSMYREVFLSGNLDLQGEIVETTDQSVDLLLRRSKRKRD